MLREVVDPDIAAVFAQMAALGALPPAPARGDWAGLRAQSNANLARLTQMAPTMPEIATTDYRTRTADGHELLLRWYAKDGASPGSAVVYVHGGGMICGDVPAFDPIVNGYVARTGVPFLSVEYRLAPEVRGETPAEDVFAGILWLTENAASLGVDPARIAVMGDSAGGGIAAGAAILARDRNLPLARQILIYPMLDDRNTAPAEPQPYPSWTSDHNYTGWSALIGPGVGGGDVSPVVAPARLEDAAGLAPAYIDVGSLDLFRDEDVAYALKLMSADVPVELHVHPGVPHGFELIAPQSAVATRAMADRVRVVQAL